MTAEKSGRERTCCFTGHRPSKLSWGGDESEKACVSLKTLIYDTVATLIDDGYAHFICGMAIGCDFYFAEAVLSLREERGGITLEAAIPFEGQSAKWSARDKARYNRITTECDFVTVVQSAYTVDCMKRRNHYMVDSSAVLVAAYNGTRGGTMQTMLYAIRRGLRVIELAI